MVDLVVALPILTLSDRLVVIDIIPEEIDIIAVGHTIE
jgi:hypothetical protein